MVQHGLKQVKSIIKNVHDSVDYLNDSEARRVKFMEIANQFNLKERRLVLECKTRWNTTYDMLSCAINFKEVFARLALEDKDYVWCPSVDDWLKIEKLNELLKVFSDVTNIISGSEYPTSNRFLSVVFKIKVMLDKCSNSEDDFVKNMVKNMKERFDKYWGECNLLMAMGTLLDPRMKLNAVEYAFERMFPPEEVRENVRKVKETLFELYDEYVSLYNPPTMEQSGECGTTTNAPTIGGQGNHELFDLIRAARRTESVNVRKSEVDDYFDEGCYYVEEGDKFDPIEWWKEKSLKYRVLSRVAVDILAVPVTTVASEATFSAGSRIIDPYRAKLTPETVQMLICGEDWCRALYGVKRKNKVRQLSYLCNFFIFINDKFIIF